MILIARIFDAQSCLSHSFFNLIVALVPCGAQDIYLALLLGLQTSILVCPSDETQNKPVLIFTVSHAQSRSQSW